MVDPSELAARFSLQDSMQYMDSIFEEPSEESQVLISRIQGILDLLPPREADFVNLYYFSRLKQTAIAKIFRCSQPTVCYRLQRAAARIQFLLSLPDVNTLEVEAAMRSFLRSEVDVQIMVLMYETTCQSEAAKRLGITQGKVRHRFMRSLEKMREIAELDTFVILFDKISENLNILREVCRSSLEDATLNIVD
jgi:DNA-directed RNA polymerase specialized sigma24 family protein